MNPKVDHYLLEGCGRCALYATPACKVHTWEAELQLLRRILNDCGLTETLKWDIPCYTYGNKNIALIGAFKENCVLSFFKGALLSDTFALLEKPGEHTQSARVIRFRSVGKILEHEEALRTYIFEAVEIEKNGLKVPQKSTEEYTIPAEFAEALQRVEGLETAFRKLTPGRQRAYLLYFSDARQAKTRVDRINKFIPHILAGKGFTDR